MGIFREIPPTAGFKLSLKDFLSASKKGSLEDDLRNYLGLSYVKVTYSGTAAFYLILEGLKSLSGKTTVIIPSFVCPLLALAIKRAGLKVEICDINKDNFSYDSLELDRLCSDNKDILAVLAVHLAGIPVDFSKLKEIAGKRNIFIIEDCAQSLGAIYSGRITGTLGDFSFFSFCRGKGLTIYEGGAIATDNKEYAAIIEQKARLFVKNDFFSEAIKIFELFGYWIFYRPRLFWLVFNLPEIFWMALGNKMKAAAEYFTVDFPIHKVSGFRKAIGHVAFERLDEEVEKQRQKALAYLERLKGCAVFRVIKEVAGTQASYPYLTLIFYEPYKRDRALKIFKKSGLGVSQIYACAVTEYDYLKEIIPRKSCPGACYIAEREITLSTSVFLTMQDIESVVNTIKGL